MPVTILDLVVIGIVLISGLLAMVRGFTREVLAIGSWAVAAGVAPPAYRDTLVELADPGVGSDAARSGPRPSVTRSTSASENRAASASGRAPSNATNSSGAGTSAALLAGRTESVACVGSDTTYDPGPMAYTYDKLYNSNAFTACTNMPRFGLHSWLTPEQITHIVGFLVDPESPVNKD